MYPYSVTLGQKIENDAESLESSIMNVQAQDHRLQNKDSICQYVAEMETRPKIYLAAKREILAREKVIHLMMHDNLHH